jgi:hypothetical protein
MARGEFEQDAYSPLEAAEVRAGVDPINQLLDERSVLVERVADLRARFGSFGTFDHLRKIELSRLSGLIRAQATRDKRKMNNDQVDEEAHAHADYIDFITEATKQRAEWVRTEAKIDAIDMRINRGQAVLRFVTSEPRV